MLDQDLLEILVCPQCKGELRYEAREASLICETCRLRYPVREGIPVLLVQEATPLD